MDQETGRRSLIWASTTPVRARGKLEQFDPKTERVKARNRAAAELMTQEKVPTDDLFALVADRPEWFSSDGIHLNHKGSTAMGQQVAAQLLGLLEGAN